MNQDFVVPRFHDVSGGEEASVWMLIEHVYSLTDHEHRSLSVNMRPIFVDAITFSIDPFVPFLRPIGERDPKSRVRRRDDRRRTPKRILSALKNIELASDTNIASPQSFFSLRWHLCGVAIF